MRFIYGKWTDYIKSACGDDYDDYMKNNAHKFRVPDRPDASPVAETSSGASPSTPRRMFSKLNSLTRSFTGSTSSFDHSLTVEQPSHHQLSPSHQSAESISPSSEVPDVGNGTATAPSNGDIPKSDSSNSLDIPNSRLLWQVRPRPEDSSQFYNFTYFALSLNELRDEMKKVLPPTDSRLRPDIRLLEEGDVDSASSEKNRLEEKQRDARKNRKGSKAGYSPLWFKQEQNPFTNEEDWIYQGGYWERNSYDLCPDIF